MAHPDRRRAENVPGPLYVDTTCIDCDTCRWMAPRIFADVGDQSAVVHQPEDATERLAAYKALVACPTASIGTTERHPEMKQATRAFPDPIVDGVGHCGYHAESSFGAASYFIERPGGNVLVDSPRFVPPLVDAIRARGGIRYLYLTHRDDVADQAKWAAAFGCERILHADDVTRATKDVEIQPEGEDALLLAPDLKVLPVPGHTRGHSVLLYQDKVLFSGDHLAWSARRQDLTAFRGACWYSWEHQTRSMRKLQDERFEWVLPGHGRRVHLPHDQMQASLGRLVAWMERA